MTQIESGVKPPKSKKKKSGNKLKYKWNEMKIGDSFVVEGINSIQACSISASGRAYFNRKNQPFKIIQKKDGDSVRFWCVKK